MVAFDQQEDGTLTSAHSFSTGGNGGALNGAVVDRLASQGSLTFDPRHALLFAVNAGSNTVSVFAVDGSQLSLREIVPSAGEFPVSVAVHNDLAYVLNARAGGSVSGYQVRSGLLQPIPGSTRPLALDPAATPEFTSTPGQVGFSPDGRQLIVTTKGNGSNVDVFRVLDHGLLSDSPVVNNLPGAVPFAFDFDRAGNLVLTEAGPNAVESFTLRHDGAITPIASVATGQAATCWVTHIESHFYASNAGSASLTEVDSTVRAPKPAASCASRRRLGHLRIESRVQRTFSSVHHEHVAGTCDASIVLNDLDLRSFRETGFCRPHRCVRRR